MRRSILYRGLTIGLSLLLLGIVFPDAASAAKEKHTIPGQATNVRAVGGLNLATVMWKKPSSNGGMRIDSYKITIYPINQTHLCKSPSTRCRVDIANPAKPSSKPKSVYYAFTVRAINSIGEGSESAKSGYVAIKFRASITLRPSYPTPKLTPRPTHSLTPPPTTLPQRSGITTFDGKYQGTAIVTVTQNEQVISLLSSTLSTSNTVLNGDITGAADIWKINGYVTDVSGVATVTASNSMYGAMTFTVTFVSDPVTHVVKGNGKGTNTVEYAGVGTIKVVFDFSISNAA